MSLAELMAMLQAQRTGAVVPMSAAGVPLGSRGPTLQEIVDGRKVPNQNPSPLPPGWIGVRG